ncbi:hypothetical protein [Streptomyces sp. RKAG293]|uniref:hypothetical protein n=1 Tax=Streptomyces sp. RKAG293 TaxID=2893403 RepID=UPI0020332497|nr:hypothetical protein [Streptomyces sp. RKAG293]MCM2416567.1 hypothetical protein [Streptomyces sp. RKAG293]
MIRPLTAVHGPHAKHVSSALDRDGHDEKVPGPGLLPDSYEESARSGEADSDDYWKSTVRLTFDGRYVPHDWEGLPERTTGGGAVCLDEVRD